jgi:hypothetical protein
MQVALFRIVRFGPRMFGVFVNDSVNGHRWFGGRSIHHVRWVIGDAVALEQ